MLGMSDDEGESRTASVGLARLQSNTSVSKDNNSRKGPRKNDRSRKNDFHDFVPKGGKFTTTPLALDTENSTSPARSDSSNSDEEPEQKMNKRQRTNAPAINWNQASRSTIRTSLGTRTTLTGVKIQTKSAFDAVNDKYFRSRSASASGEDTHEDNHADSVKVGQNTNGESKTYYMDDSDGSDTGEVSEGDDSMMLNIGQQSIGHVLDVARDDSVNDSTPPFVLDTSPNLNLAPINTSISRIEQQTPDIRENGSVLSDHSLAQLPPRSKAEAFAEFAATYKTSPAILADLEIKDLETQNRFFFYNSSIHDLDLTRPISCTECLQEGHLAFVCPSKEVCRLLV
jgi:protein AIR1/2